MTAINKALVVIAWLGVLVAVFAAGTQHQTVMAIAGIVATLAAGTWGLVRWIADDEPPVDMTAYRAQVWARRDAEQDEAELPYRAPIRTDVIYRTPVAWQHIEGGKKALWPSEIGAPE